MNIDTFLKIGHSHTICQDYILTGSDPCEYIILADGCSQAADSDIGARILCHQAVKYLKTNYKTIGDIDGSKIGDEIILKSVYVARLYFNVEIECLDATLIIAFKYEGEYRIIMYGDGCVWFVSKEDEIDYYNASYEPNAPYYLRYRLKGNDDYLKNNILRYMTTPHGKFKNTEGSTVPFDLRISEDKIKMILLASDGVESFRYKEELMYKTLYLNLLSSKSIFTRPPAIKEIDFFTVCQAFTNFKLTKGSFLSRRVKKVLKEYLKDGFINDDDLAIGCFYEE